MLLRILFVTEHLVHTEKKSQNGEKCLYFFKLSVNLSAVHHVSAASIQLCSCLCCICWLSHFQEGFLNSWMCCDTAGWLCPKKVLHCATVLCPIPALWKMSGRKGTFCLVRLTSTFSLPTHHIYGCLVRTPLASLL